MSLLKFALFAALLLALALAAAACASPAAPEQRDFTLQVQERKLTPSLAQVTQNDTVTLNISTDEAATLHVHGYDHEIALRPGEVATLQFVADATGRFPIALHGFGTDHLDDHGAVFQSEIIPPSGSYTYTASRDLAGKTLTYHSHLDESLNGTLRVMHDGPDSAQAEVTEQGITPAEITIREGGQVTWTNRTANPHMLTSGQHPGATAGGDGHSHEGETSDEIDVGALEVRPR